MTTATAPLAKSITYDRLTRDYRMELDGRFVGFARSYSEAERILNETAFEWLTHGEYYSAAELDGAQAACSDDEPEPPEVNWNSHCSACHTDDYPESAILPDLCVSCANARYFGLANRFTAADQARAFTAQSEAIEAKMRRCGNCGGEHHVQACGELRAALFEAAPVWADVDLGRELCRMRWRDHATFAALLRVAPPAHVTMYAASYQAFIRSYRPESDLTVDQVVQSWTNEIWRGAAAQPPYALLVA